MDLVESSFVWVPVSFMLGLGSGLFICYKFSKRRPFPKNGDRNSIVSVMSDKSQVIAHKGAALDGPENTLGAIRKAAANGADGIEMDIMLTKDKRAVLMHDYTVDRTTDGQGRVKDFTFEEINKLDAASKFEGEWNEKEPVPLMEDAVKIALDNNMFIFLDVKDVSSGTIEEILDLFERYPQMYSRSAICAFNYSFLYRVTFAAKKAIKVVPIYEGFTPLRETNIESFRDLIETIKLFFSLLLSYILFFYVNRLFLTFDVVSVEYSLITKKFVRWWHKKKKHVVAWTVNDGDIKIDFVNQRISIITDRIDTGSISTLKMKYTNPKIELVPLYAGYDVTTDYFGNYPYAPIPASIVQLLAYFMFYYVNRLLIPFNAVSVSQDVIDKKYPTWWNDRGGVNVVAWTVNKAEKKHFLRDMNVSFITDQIRD